MQELLLLHHRWVFDKCLQVLDDIVSKATVNARRSKRADISFLGSQLEAGRDVFCEKVVASFPCFDRAY